MGLRPHLVRHLAHPACVDLLFAWTLDRVIASFAPGRFDYSNDCAHYLGTFHPELTAFSGTCAERHDRMVVYNVDSTLTEHGHDDHHFVAEQGLAYKFTETPAADGPERTEMELEAEGTNHPLAQQQDVTKQSDGTHEVIMLQLFPWCCWCCCVYCSCSEWCGVSVSSSSGMPRSTLRRWTCG